MAWTLSGNIKGPPGTGGTGNAFVAITQEDYDDLSPPDANTLYIIVTGVVLGQGNEWIALTESDYAAIGSPDPDTLYIVRPD